MIRHDINIKFLIRNINLDILSNKDSEYTELYYYTMNLLKCLNEYEGPEYYYDHGRISPNLIFYGYSTDELLIVYNRRIKRLYVSTKLSKDISDTFFTSNIVDSIDIVLDIISYLFEIHFNKNVSMVTLSAMSKLIKK